MTQRVVDYTYGTGNSVLPNGSIDVRDGIDNLQSMDVFMNAPEDTYNQRDGEIVRTVAGMNNEFDAMIVDMNSEFDAQILNMGFTRIGTFAAGATLTNPRQTLLWDVNDGGDGQEYGWSGSFPKVVPAASTPASTGGISAGAWISRFDPVLNIHVDELQRRSYAEAGYNLVGGSFESGGTLSSTSDVLTYEATGDAYSWTGAYPSGSYSVPPGTNPTANPLFVNKSASLLRSLLMGGGSLSMPCRVINVDLPPYSGDLSALIESVDSNTVIVLGNRDYDLSTNPQFNGVKKNIALVGSGMPTYSSDGSRMEGGTRLLGNNVFGSCTGFAMYNLGLDCGSHVIDTLYDGTSKEGLLSIGNEQFFDNIRVLIKSNPAQLKHGILFEGHENIVHGFLETRGGYHGYVAKSKSITGGDVVVNETAGTMAIFKADNAKVYAGINVNSITYNGKDGLTPSLIFEAITNGTLSGVRIGRFVATKAGHGVVFTKDTSASSLSDIHIDVLDLDGCAGNGFALDNQLVGRVSIGHHSLKNCSGQGFYIDRGYSLNIGSGQVVNAGQNGYFFGGNLNRNNIQFGDIRADGCGQYGVKNDALIPINPGQVLGGSNASGLVSANFGDINVALGSGWADDFFASKVRKIGRLVTLSGIVISNKTSAVIMTLPAHLRPSVTEVFSCPVSAPVASGAVNMVRVFVQSDTGQVKIDTSAVSSVGSVVLSGISFFTAY